MITLVQIVLLVGIGLILFIPSLILSCYILAAYNIFFTRVPAGEIIAITYSEKVSEFIGNVSGYWVHPQSGQVYEERANPKPSNIVLPTDFWGTGIYWLGFWPLAARHTYEFHWNKWAKSETGGRDSSDYDIIAKSADADSVYFRAQYPLRASGLETKDGVPTTQTILLTVQMHNVNTALFIAKSPGYLSALSGQALAVLRDWTGKTPMQQITELEAEIPGGTSVPTGKKTPFQEAFLTLNDSKNGNPSIKDTFGVEIVAVSFIGYEIEKPKNDLQETSLAKYNAARAGDAAVETAEKAEKAAEISKRTTEINATAAAFVTRADGAAKADARQALGAADANARLALAKAEAEGIVLTGTAEAKAAAAKAQALADAAEKLTAAVKDNPHYSAIVLADAIKVQKNATTLVLGSGAIPTIPIK